MRACSARRRVVVCAAMAAATLTAPAFNAESSRAADDPALASLPPAYADGTRPGPAVLYAPPPVAPQLESFQPDLFKAPPLLVEGTEAYRAGEYLYQGYLYADHGAGTNSTGPGGYVGNLTYPTNLARYGNNAANLVEFRISTLDASAVSYRFTFNTLLAPDTTIAVAAFDTDENRATGCSRLPHDPGAPFPGTDAVLSTWGTGADWSTCSGGKWTVTPVQVDENMSARQFTVTVPRSLSNPHGAWRATVAVGLYDGKGGFLQPVSTATATQPGGAPSNGKVSGIFDLGFRFNEPPSWQNTLPLFSNVGDSPDQEQATALAANDPTALQHPIDWDLLDQRANQSTVPSFGNETRIFASRLQLGQGVDPTNHEIGQLQPYELTIPEGYRPGHPVPFMFALHSAGDRYWQFVGSQGLRDWSDGHGQIVATPDAHGPDLDYRGIAEYDVFEVWNDVARHFSLDPSRMAFYGYSMGGLGAHWICSLYPDLCGKAYEVVGGAFISTYVPPFKETSNWQDDPMIWLENVRHVPILDVYGTADEYEAFGVFSAENLTPKQGFEDAGLQELGYRYEAAYYPAAEHLTFAGAGYRIPLEVQFLDDTAVEHDAAHVTFSYVPLTDDPQLGLVHNHAYWVSGVKLASPNLGPPLLPQQAVDASGGLLQDADNAPRAAVDAVSAAFGEGDPSTSQVAGAGVGPGPLPYTEYGQTWNSPPQQPKANRLTASLTNVGEVTFDVRQARLDPTHQLTLDLVTSTSSTVTLTGGFGPKITATLDGSPLTVTSVANGVELAVPKGTHVIVLSPGSPDSPEAGGTPGASPQPASLDTGDGLGTNGCMAQAGSACTFVADDAYLQQGYIAAVQGAAYSVVDDNTGQKVVSASSDSVAAANFAPYHHFTLTVGPGSGLVYAGDVTVPQPYVGTGGHNL